MKKEYRITEIPKSVPPMWKLEERGGYPNTGTQRRWHVVTLGVSKETLEGVRDDIKRQAADEHNGIRE